MKNYLVARRLSCRVRRTYARASQGFLRGSFMVGRLDCNTENQCGKAKFIQIKSLYSGLDWYMPSPLKVGLTAIRRPISRNTFSGAVQAVMPQHEGPSALH